MSSVSISMAQGKSGMLMSDFTIGTSAPGAGDVEVRFRLGECYGEKQAIGNRLGPVLREYMRRHHWEKENAPLCISFVETQAEVPNDEVPF